MKTARYNLINGGTAMVEYDETAPCRVCGLPVGEASMGGTDVCPSCDCGLYRDGSPILTPNVVLIQQRAREIADALTPPMPPQPPEKLPLRKIIIKDSE